MVRISDIFKRPDAGKPSPAPEAKSKEEPAKEKPFQESRPEIAPFHPEISSHKAEFQKEETEIAHRDSMRIAKAMKETVSDKARSHNLYLMGIQLIREVLTNAEELKPISLVQLAHWVGDIVDCLISTDAELLRLFYEYASDNYLHSHMVNTAIMSTEIGLGLDYNKSQLSELGLAAFLHDIGMIKVAKLEMQERRLSESEYNEVKNHPVYGADILSKIKDIAEPIIYVAKEEHERMNGAGYPNGLKNGEISEYARIVMIVDVYEALTHNRPYRKKVSPHEAVKELIASNSLFDSLILKVLINKVGVYPLSSWIELNSNEIGRVTINNNEFPLRPVVNILFDATGHKLRESRTINLAKQFNLFIKNALTEEELAKNIKEPIEF
ncbi:HD domain-containing protein [bacterium]|nr:MAG: HD domain-containing protein [bacterium]